VQREAFAPHAVELNPEFALAVRLAEEEGKSLFVTGCAGTGKSTLVRYLMATTAKRAIVLAPTGVAALAIGGQTIHSFFHLPPRLLDVDEIKPIRDAALIRNLDLIVLDEASMISANLMDAVDKSLRLNREEEDVPFGGVQVVLVGDLYQLPPVVRESEREFFADAYGGIFFFQAPVFRKLRLPFVELLKTYRQHDPEFLRLLGAIRLARAEPDVLAVLEGRIVKHRAATSDDPCVTLTPTNAAAQALNMRHLEGLKSQERVFEAEISGDFDTTACQAEPTLRLKCGAPVMLLNNDRDGRWVNGSMGIVSKLGANAAVVRIGDSELPVGPHTWEMLRYSFDGKSKRVRSEVVGALTQLPLKLAWALTIHKSQGQTLDLVHVDLGTSPFAPGQTYVALSRCRSLQGLSLSRGILRSDLIIDPAVQDYQVIFDRAWPAPLPVAPGAVSPGASRAAVYRLPDTGAPRIVAVDDTAGEEQLGRSSDTSSTYDGVPFTAPSEQAPSERASERSKGQPETVPRWILVASLAAFVSLAAAALVLVSLRGCDQRRVPITEVEAASHIGEVVDITFLVGDIVRGAYGNRDYVIVFSDRSDRFQVQIDGTGNTSDPRLRAAGFVTGRAKTLRAVVITTTTGTYPEPKVVLNVDDLE